MARLDPTAARFPSASLDAGLYESFYLKACHPSEPVGVWIRYTVHKRPGAAPNGSVWFTLFDRRAAGPRAAKLTLPDPASGDGSWLRIGESRIGEGEASGTANTEPCSASWELRFATSEPPLFHLPSMRLYTAPLPKTKLLSPAPAATFDGSVNVDGEEISVAGWRGMIGHNWGAQHAERWIWLHGLGFEGAGEGTWMDAAIGRIQIGPVTTPWVANGALSLDGKRVPLGGLGKRVEIRETPERCEFVLPGKGLKVRGVVSAEKKDFVGWVYADPDGPEHNTVNCSASDMQLVIEPKRGPQRELKLSGGAAYELGMRETDHGVPIQPFPDG